MKVLQLRTPLQNIGNGFIDLGAQALIEEALEDPEIVQVSGFGPTAQAELDLGELVRVWPRLGELGRRFWRRTVIDEASGPNTPLTEFVDADVAVLSGCVLSRPGLGNYYEVLADLNERGIPIVILGGGGTGYEDASTRAFVRRHLGKLNVEALISRDPRAHELYHDAVPFAHEGTDCAFFVSDAVNPPTLEQPFVAMTFDNTSEPEIETDKKIVRPIHTPFGYSSPFSGMLFSGWNWFARKKTHFEKENWFAADLPADYLMVYKNADITYSDRIHACIPALSYGNRALFTHQTERAAVFDPLVPGGFGEEPFALDASWLKKARERQAKALRDAIGACVG